MRKTISLVCLVLCLSVCFVEAIRNNRADLSLTPTPTASQSPSNTNFVSKTTTATQSPRGIPTPSPIPLPCEAFEIRGLKTTGNATVFGSTVGLPYYYPTQGSSSCNRGNSGTAWYKISPGPNSNVTISTCGDYTNFDTLLGVYTGECNNLQCFTFDDDTTECSGGASKVTMTQTTENDYYISVSGYNAGYEGTFQLLVTSTSGFNQDCEAAIPISGPFYTPVNVDGNTIEGHGSFLQSCGLNLQSKADWYKIFPSGTGAKITISACNFVTDFDAKISVFSGSCTSLECVSVQDHLCDLPAPVNTDSDVISFIPDVDTTYYVVVHGAGDESGYYQMKISEESD